MVNEKLLNQWAEQTKISLDTIRGIYDKSQSEIKTKNPKITPDVLESKAMEKTRMELKKKFKTKGTRTDMLVLGVFIQDDAKKPLEEATATWKANPEVAVAKGFASSDGKFFFTKGFRKGNEIPPHAFRLCLIGINRNGERIMANWNKDSDKVGVEGWKDLPTKIETFTWYNFPLVKAKNDAEGFSSYYVSGDIMFEKLSPVSKTDLDMVKKVYEILSINQLSDFATKNAENFNSYAIITGNITNMKLPKTADSTGYLEIDDGNLENLVDESGNLVGTVTGWSSSLINLGIEITGEPIPSLTLMRVGLTDKKQVRTSLGGFYVKDEYRATNVEKIDIEPTPPIHENGIKNPTPIQPQTKPPTSSSVAQSPPENKATKPEDDWF